jgi:nucleoside-diphosphate-sugar epimerase
MVLVSGSTGFIGKTFLRALDADVRIISRTKHPTYETVICNFETEDIPKSSLESIDTIYHIAGFAHDMRDASEIEDLYYRVNVAATVQLANLAVKSGVKKFVFVSSVKAGGSPTVGKCSSEIDQGDPEGVYGKTKREAELKLLKIGKESGMHVAIIRPSLVYGPNVKGNLQLMMAGVAKNWFPPLPETGNKKSMIHVDDLVRAILFIAQDKRANGEIFIATDGAPHSSREVYNAMCNVLDRPIPKWSVPKFLFDMLSLASPRIKYKINKLLGNECYSCKKINSLGFETKRTLKDMNKTCF